jgi:hypothetical protein
MGFCGTEEFFFGCILLPLLVAVVMIPVLIQLDRQASLQVLPSHGCLRQSSKGIPATCIHGLLSVLQAILCLLKQTTKLTESSATLWIMKGRTTPLYALSALTSDSTQPVDLMVLFPFTNLHN